MKRHSVTKSAAVLAALLLTTMCAVLPAGAANADFLIPCTAEAEGSPIPFDITVSSAGNAGGNTGNAGNAGGVTEGLIPGGDSFGTADDAVGGNDPAGDMAEQPSRNEQSDTAGKTDNTQNDAAGNPNAGNGNREEGQAGGNEDGKVGEGSANRTEGTTGTGTDTADNPVENAVNEAADAVDNAADGSGTGWGGIIIALLIAAALIDVIIALIPRRRTD